MPNFEYKVVPAPRKGLRAKGIRGAENKFANALQDVMNTNAADGWDYFRTDTLPCDERQGLTGRSTTYQNMLVFRRALADQQPAKNPASVKTDVTPVRAKRIEAEKPQILPVSEPATQGANPGYQAKADQIRTESPTLGGVTKEDPGNQAPAPDRTPT
ncbi:MAG: DUF4177 domain-containing protein [Marinosulfonomonas sp.]|nr:DUF4177 domain-containing protein [Marinosulfonomonas sp.]